MALRTPVRKMCGSYERGGEVGAYENADGIKKQGDLTVVGLPDVRLCSVRVTQSIVPLR
jgi:hypothetical protein